MRKIFILITLFVSIYNYVNAQCISGDCKNGKGKFDFGWCVYEGDFKNEKPDGNGIMKYDDYTYSGTFKNGVEDGRGFIAYKNGKTEDVMYSNGKKLDYKPIALKDGEYKELEGYDTYCKSGNCNTGFGTYVYPSGNKYIGNFVNSKREGKGTFYFSNGDRFEGTFHNSERSEGVYTYSNGAKYIGSYDASGIEYNGTMTALNGMTIPFINGKAIIPAQPKNTVTTISPNPSNKQTDRSVSKVCPFCNGAGKTRSASYYGNASNSDKDRGIYQGAYHSGETTTCSFCKGKGGY